MHDVIVNGETLLNHGFYLDAGGGDMDIAYNWVSNILEGNLIQTYASHAGGNLVGLLITTTGSRQRQIRPEYFRRNTLGTYWNNIVIGANLAGVRVKRRLRLRDRHGGLQ